MLKAEAEVQARTVIPALRAAAPPPQAEVYTMKIKMMEWLADDRIDAGRWAVAKGYIPSTVNLAPKLVVCIGTYNIWFDTENDPETRWNAAFDLVFVSNELDIVALQELSKPSWALLKRRQDVRKDWIVVECDEVLRVSGSWYGSSMLVRRTWMAKHGIDKVDTSITLFGSPMQRAFVALEFSTPEGIAFRIGTSHFESGPADQTHRRRQFYTAARIMSFPDAYTVVEPAPDDFPPSVDDFIATLGATAFSSKQIPHSVICGDTNVEAYDELAPLLDSPLSYVDTFDRVHPTPSGEDRYRRAPTFFTTYKGVHYARSLSEKRIDYVLARPSRGALVVKEAKLIGDTPVVKNGVELPDLRGTDGKTYPSDHLGVVVTLEFELDPSGLR